MQDYRSLKVWERSHILTIALYRMTQDFPEEEKFGLTSQIRRACYSIPSNIAEGCGRNSDAELKRFLSIALGSASELDYFLLLATELGYLKKPNDSRMAAEIQEIRRMLGTFIRKLGAKP